MLIILEQNMVETRIQPWNPSVGLNLMENLLCVEMTNTSNSFCLSNMHLL